MALIGSMVVIDVNPLNGRRCIQSGQIDHDLCVDRGSYPLFYREILFFGWYDRLLSRRPMTMCLICTDQRLLVLVRVDVL